VKEGNCNSLEISTVCYVGTYAGAYAGMYGGGSGVSQNDIPVSRNTAATRARSCVSNVCVISGGAGVSQDDTIFQTLFFKHSFSF
jgi:hypothetical protein